MPVIRKFAIQGHEVPTMAYRPHGPFPPEVLAQNQVAYGDFESDSLHVALDDIRMFRCRDCEEVMYEDETNNHTCEEI
jgi:predicted alpha/beta hydrolase